jgi:hypothetical protein
MGNWTELLASMVLLLKVGSKITLIALLSYLRRQGIAVTGVLRQPDI